MAERGIRIDNLDEHHICVLYNLSSKEGRLLEGESVVKQLLDDHAVK